MVQPVGLFDCMDLATPTVGPHALVRHSPRNRDLARHSSTTTEPLATGTFKQCYKMPDHLIRAVIGQKSGQSSKFDIMQDQSTRDSRYQNANLEYGCRSLPALSTRTSFVERRVIKPQPCVLPPRGRVCARGLCQVHMHTFHGWASTKHLER
jgi:hypothetical protein